MSQKPGCKRSFPLKPAVRRLTVQSHNGSVIPVHLIQSGSIVNPERALLPKSSMVVVTMPDGKSIFADYIFDPQSGELTPVDQDGDTTVNRLPPQPSQLLELLLENFPEVVSREAIQRHLWPGLSSDYENNLHFCIRQIRLALGDSASNPKFLETIPRRGYRWLVEPRQLEESEDIEAGQQIALDEKANSSNCVADVQAVDVQNREANTIDLIPSPDNGRRSGSGLSLLIMFAVVCLIAVSGFLVFSQWNGQKSRVAVMPFATDKSEFSSIGDGEIAFRILEQLDITKLEVIGPSTTDRFDSPSLSLRRMADELELDWIVNGKFYLEDARPVILAEIIRASDGAHIWVQRFSPDDAAEHVSQTIVEAIHRLL